MSLKDPILKEAKSKMDKTVKHLEEEYKKLRTGRPSPALFEEIMVDYYGAPTPINQTATLTVGEDRTVVITPWDKSLCSKIEKAINTANLGMMASTDGVVVRVKFPNPTVEDRRKWVKHAKELAEEMKIALRNIRREDIKVIKEKQKNGEIPEDDAKKLEDEIQNILKEHENKIDEVFHKKEKEIMES
nr:ribosome recycling factor [Marinitoga sp. 38H-ov]